MKTPRVIVITGASSGLGAALARHYASPGVTLHLLGRNEERLRQVANECLRQGAIATMVPLDARDQQGMEAWLKEVDAATPVDLIIANAGVSGGSGGNAVMGEDAGQVRRILAVNIDGMINTVLPLIPAMVSRGRGQIAIMSSLAGLRGLPSAPAYSMSKAAVKAYGEALRGWLSHTDVQVSVIMPGYIRTPMTARNPFPMPFLMEAEKAAAIIARGLARNRARIAFPLGLYWPMLMISSLPPWLTDPLFARLPAKPALVP